MVSCNVDICYLVINVLSFTSAGDVLLTSQICPAAPGLVCTQWEEILFPHQKIAEQFDPVSFVERLS